MTIDSSSDDSRQYDTFISYNRDDIAFARKLQKALESYRPSKQLHLPYRYLKVFRDESDLTGVEYYRSIEKHLRASTKLIVLCSPEARTSEFVNDEIRRFASARGADNIIPIIIRGKPNNEAENEEQAKAFPEALCEVMTMPVATSYIGFDVAHNKIDGAVFEGSWYTVLSNIFDISRSEIEQRERRRRIRRRSIAAAVVAAVILSLSVLAAVAWWQKLIAEDRARVSLSRQLAAQALSQLDKQPDLALLLSVEALRVDVNAETRGTLLTSLQTNSRVKIILHEHQRILDRRGVDPDGKQIAKGILSDIVFSRDGKLFASASDDGTILIWNTASATLVGEPLEVKLGRLSCLEFSYDGKRLAIGSFDGAIMIYDLARREPIGASLSGGPKHVWSLAFSGDDSLLAAGGAGQDGGVVTLWDLSSDEPMARTFRGHGSNVPTIAFSPDGRSLASASWDKSIRVWNVSTGESKVLVGHSDWIHDVNFSPDGRWLASASSDGSVRLWDVVSSRPVREPFSMNDGVGGVRFIRHGSLLAASTGNGITFWSLDEETQAPEPLLAYGGAGGKIAYDDNKNLLAIGSSEGTIIHWDLEANFPLVDSSKKALGAESIAFNSHGSTLAIGVYDYIVFWNFGDRVPPAEISKAHHDGIKRLVFSSDGKYLVSASIDGTARVWDAKTNAPMGEPMRIGRNGAIRDVTIDPSGSLMGVSRFGAPFEVWEIASRKPLPGAWTRLEESVDSGTFTASGATVATGGEDGTVTLWDVATGRAIGEPLLAQKSGVRSLAFTPDGSLLVTGSTDGTVLFWDVSRRELLGEQEKPGRGTVLSLAFNEDGTMLAVGGYENPVVLWDVAARRTLGDPLGLHEYAVTDMAFSPKRELLASTSGMGEPIRIWDLSLASWQIAACRKANRSLSEREWSRFVGDSLDYRDTCRKTVGEN